MEVPELPLVVDNLNVETTRTLLGTLKKLGFGEELKRSRDTRKVRQGTGKMKNSRYVLRKGPLVIYGDENNRVKRTAKNLPGVDTCSVHRLNLLQLAPGGHLGRLIIWTKDAFKALNNIFGNYRRKGIEKGGYVLNRNLMTCADISRIINSDQVQSKLRSITTNAAVHDLRKKNPLKNRSLMKKLNPFNEARKKREQDVQKDRHAKKAAAIKALRKNKDAKKSKKDRRTKHAGLLKGLQDSFQAASDLFFKQENVDQVKLSDAEDDDQE